MALASIWAPLGLAVLGCVVVCALVGGAAVVIGGRRVVARSAEYRRVTRLLEASARTARPRTFDDLLVATARVLEEGGGAPVHHLDLNRQKGEFVATVSHELRTPVAAIVGTIETVARLGDRLDDERRQSLLAGAVGYGERLSRVIEELLLVAAAEQSSATARSTATDLDALVQRVVN